MQADPLYRCWEHVVQTHGKGRTVYLSPQGRVFTQSEARRLLETPHLILVCGHYEGVDERFIEECVDEEISIGDYVITGGELAACIVADAVCRMVPGVLSGEAGFTGESHWDGLLEYPQYSRPEIWRGRAVPEVLLSGHHANIEKWRRGQSVERTQRKRPDLLTGPPNPQSPQTD
jgi:tRNA (guanine37-N1)-methyltransferase